LSYRPWDVGGSGRLQARRGPVKTTAANRPRTAPGTLPDPRSCRAGRARIRSAPPPTRCRTHPPRSPSPNGASPTATTGPSPHARPAPRTTLRRARPRSRPGSAHPR